MIFNESDVLSTSAWRRGDWLLRYTVNIFRFPEFPFSRFSFFLFSFFRFPFFAFPLS